MTPDPPWAILTDTTLCTGCEKCVEACRSKNKLGNDVPRRWKKRIDDLSSTRYTTILRCKDEEKPGNHFVRQQCRHCLQPACVSACLVGALQQKKNPAGIPEGPVIYDSDKCMGCRYCMMACPFGIPRYDWEKPVPYVRKCDMCYERVAEGGQPACVDACPEKATIFGNRDVLLEEADRRIQGNPDKYIGKVFGRTEVGGTAVIYISDIPLDFLSFNRELGDESLPDLTWAALGKVPPLVVAVGGVMAGVWWIVGRRMKLAEETTRPTMAPEEAHRKPSEPAQSPETDEEK